MEQLHFQVSIIDASTLIMVQRREIQVVPMEFLKDHVKEGLEVEKRDNPENNKLFAKVFSVLFQTKSLRKYK